MYFGHLKLFFSSASPLKKSLGMLLLFYLSISILALPMNDEMIVSTLQRIGKLALKESPGTNEKIFNTVPYQKISSETAREIPLVMIPNFEGAQGAHGASNLDISQDLDLDLAGESQEHVQKSIQKVKHWFKTKDKPVTGITLNTEKFDAVVSHTPSTFMKRQRFNDLHAKTL
jgi:hypothetical protein